MCTLRQLREIIFKRSKFRHHMFCIKKQSRERLVDRQHITLDESIFKKNERRCDLKVTIGNDKLLEAKGKGEVVISSLLGTKVISDVLLVPAIDKNLLSISQLLEKNYNIVLQNYIFIIFDSLGSDVVIVSMNNRSFVLDWNLVNPKNLFQSIDDTNLWHKRLGHAKYKSLSRMFEAGLVEEIINKNIKQHRGIYDVCQFGKHARLAFPTNQAWGAYEMLQLVHSYVCGPIKTSSLNGCRYFILFIDDCTRYCWVYFLKQKYDVAEVFWKFEVKVKNQTDCKLKKVVSDNGAEIRHQLTKIYTPQQNGVCERKNKRIMDMVRCLLFESKLPKEFWAETANISIQLLNRLPTKATKRGL